MPSGPSRRMLVGLGLAAGGAGLALGGGAGAGIAEATRPAAPADQVVPFYGRRQAGIVTAAQEQLAFAAFDVVTSDVERLKAMLGAWSAAIARMSRGERVGPTEGVPSAPPVDTGEALGLGPAQLTATVGFGPSLFDERFGLAGRRPAALAPLPALPGDALEAARGGGDLCVQACADDPQICFHTIRNLARIGRGVVVMRWSQLGFGRTATTSRSQSTPRNLMGFKDGTNNLKAEDTAALERFVWVGGESDQAWMRDGSYLVARRIRMMIESWDVDNVADQQNVFGRHKDSGAPLSGRHEFDTVDLAARDAHGGLVIGAEAHIRLASPSVNGGIRILRRGYSFTDGTDPKTGELDAGLFFIAFVKDAHQQFVPLQRGLGAHDALNEYIKHTGSALFACPPGVREVGDWFGRALFG